MLLVHVYCLLLRTAVQAIETGSWNVKQFFLTELAMAKMHVAGFHVVSFGSASKLNEWKDKFNEASIFGSASDVASSGRGMRALAGSAPTGTIKQLVLLKNVEQMGTPGQRIDQCSQIGIR